MKIPDLFKPIKPMAELMQKFIDSTDPTRDVKLAAFGSVVIAGITWLSLDWKAHGITDGWVGAFKWLCALVGGGGPLWAWVESKRNPSGPDSQDPPSPGGEV